jgi:hypothetical protein
VPRQTPLAEARTEGLLIRLADRALGWGGQVNQVGDHRLVDTGARVLKEQVAVALVGEKDRIAEVMLGSHGVGVVRVGVVALVMSRIGFGPWRSTAPGRCPGPAPARRRKGPATSPATGPGAGSSGRVVRSPSATSRRARPRRFGAAAGSPAAGSAARPCRRVGARRAWLSVGGRTSRRVVSGRSLARSPRRRLSGGGFAWMRRMTRNLSAARTRPRAPPARSADRGHRALLVAAR